MKKWMQSERDYLIRKTIISKKDRYEKKRMLDEIKKFTTIHKQTRKFHKKKGKQTKRYYD